LGLTFAASVAGASTAIAIRGAERGVAASGRLTFGEPRLAASTQITCDVTILRTIGSSIAKTPGTLFGKVTGVAIDRGPRGEHCAKGSTVESITDIIPLRDRGVAGTHTELGGGVLLYVVTGGRAELWKLIYRTFLGVLPEITGILFRVEQAQFLLRGAVECLYKGGVEVLVRIERRVVGTGTILLALTSLPRDSGSILCPVTTGTLSGTFTLTPRLTIELI